MKSFTSEDKMWIRHLVKELPIHETAPETKKLINDLTKKMENHVTKDLLDAKFEDLKEYLGEKFKYNDQGHDRIETQTVKHNGRLKKLEMWRAGLIGAWAVASFVSIAVVPTVFYLYVKDIKADINGGMEKIVEEYIDENYELNE